MFLEHTFRRFVVFVLLSGVGWLCDFVTFVLLVKVVGVPGFIANMASSYVGVTFVWFTSLRAVFGRTIAARSRFLLFYWGFQFVSILAYSQLLHWVAGGLLSAGSPIWILMDVGVSAKIIITPFNLITNFLFMKWLMQFIQQVPPTQS